MRTSEINREVIRMTKENRDNRSIEDLLLENEALRERTDFLQKRNNQLSFQNQNLTEIVEELEKDCKGLEDELSTLQDSYSFLQKQNKALKLRCGKYSLEIGELTSELQDLKFTHKYLNSEDAGKAFARELLGKPMTADEIAVDKAENQYDYYKGDDF